MIKKFDGGDEIIYAGVFNVYENVLRINNLYQGYNFKFVFEENLPSLPSPTQKDVSAIGEGKDVTVTFSAKLRNTLGSGTSTKLPVVNLDDGKILLFSVYCSKVGDNTTALNVSVNFYLR